MMISDETIVNCSDTENLPNKEYRSSKCLSKEFGYTTKGRKMIIVFLISFACFLSPMSSTMILPAVQIIASELHTTENIINVSNAGYCILSAISPCTTSPFADGYGRRLTFLICLCGFTMTSILVSLSKNLPMFFVFRCASSFFGTSFFGVGASIIGDIYIPSERGSAMGYILIGSQAGLAIAAVLGGLIITYTTWRVIIYVLAGLGLLLFMMSFLLLPETSKSLKIDELKLLYPEKKFIWIKFNPFSVVKAGRYPNVLLASLVSSTITYNMYCLLTPIRYVVDPIYSLEKPILGSLFYFGPGLGYIIGSLFGGKWADYSFHKGIKARGKRVPEDRLRSTYLMNGIIMPASILVYGWGLEKQKGGIAVTVICMFLNGLSQTICFPSINAYCIDCIPQLKGDVIANNYFIRFIAAAIASGTVLPQIQNIGIGWTSTISALVLWLGLLCNIILICFGERLRKKYFPECSS